MFLYKVNRPNRSDVDYPILYCILVVRKPNYIEYNISGVPALYSFIYHPTFDSIEMVDIQHKLTFELHMSSLLKQCSQRMYLLRLLRSQGLSAGHLNNVCHALVVSRILYALPAWGVFFNAGQSGRIDAILKRAYKCGFAKNHITVTYNY